MEIYNTRAHVTHATEAQINCNGGTLIAKMTFNRKVTSQDTGGIAEETFKIDLEGSYQAESSREQQRGSRRRGYSKNIANSERCI